MIEKIMCWSKSDYLSEQVNKFRPFGQSGFADCQTLLLTHDKNSNYFSRPFFFVNMPRNRDFQVWKMENRLIIPLKLFFHHRYIIH